MGPRKNRTRSGKRRAGVKLLAALLALHTVAGMCAAAFDLVKTGRQIKELQQSLQQTACELEDLRRALAAHDTPETVRKQAFRQYSMVYPEDVVFFDGGTWCGDSRKNKGG